MFTTFLLRIRNLVQLSDKLTSSFRPFDLIILKDKCATYSVHIRMSLFLSETVIFQCIARDERSDITPDLIVLN